RVVAALQPGAEISERLRTHHNFIDNAKCACYISTTVVAVNNSPFQDRVTNRFPRSRSTDGLPGNVCISVQLSCLPTKDQGGVMPSRLSILAAFTFFLLSVTSAVGQTDRGSLTGRVADPNGAAVANAKVTATNINTAETREVNTSDDGNYTIPELKADPYKVTVEAQGFKTASAENIVV